MQERHIQELGDLIARRARGEEVWTLPVRSQEIFDAAIERLIAAATSYYSEIHRVDFALRHDRGELTLGGSD